MTFGVLYGSLGANLWSSCFAIGLCDGGGVGDALDDDEGGWGCCWACGDKLRDTLGLTHSNDDVLGDKLGSSKNLSDW